MKKMPVKKPAYYLNSSGEFVIKNFNSAKPFANFFPGIAGKYGIPMWVFYVNRGQGICSFGTRSKNSAIAEFFPANKSWQLVSTHGFRTFIKIYDGKKNIFYEPFQNGFVNLEFNLTNRMSVTSYDLRLEEENSSLGLEVGVEYFTIPQDSYAGLVRIVKLKNTGARTKRLQLLDGLPQIIPFGTSNLFLKQLGRTIEAWMNIENLQKGVPFYKLNVDPVDRPEVIHIKEGNFYLAYHHEKNQPRILRPVVDPGDIFGPVTDFSCPRNFLSAKDFHAPDQRPIRNKTPCAFSSVNLELKKNEEKNLYFIIGQSRNLQMLNASLARITACGYIKTKKEENKAIIEDLQRDIETRSGCREFDLYAKQTYLDNCIRGGYPLVFPCDGKNTGKNSVFYLYSRKHGDLERDYNRFQLQPAYFSQGNGNYRDMNQNRRMDVWFHPEIQDENLIAFTNLIQTDGFNPLVIRGVKFIARDIPALQEFLKRTVREKHVQGIISLISKLFTPGELIFYLEDNAISMDISWDEFLTGIICNCERIQEAVHGEGFWTDHWHYNLDLLESYLGVYPEKMREILFEKREFIFYDNTEIVKSRAEKYMLYHDSSVKQLQAVASDNEKKQMIENRAIAPHAVRKKFGTGDIYRTTLANKFLCLLANKLASLDPFGAGVEMEANKPNWFDALNGLPALFGSSSCETLELKRLALTIKDALEKSGVKNISLSEEIKSFLCGLNALIEEYFASKASDKDYIFWDKSHDLKEAYWQKTKCGVSGQESEITGDEISEVLDNALRKIEQGLNLAKEKNAHIYCSYFMHEPVEREPLKHPFVRVKKFAQRKLPLFLEGQVHALRLASDKETARKIYRDTKKSPLYDTGIKMYKVTAPLKDMPEEIGRCRAFSPGWLENESIWLHMEYKYLLEILKQGLYNEFYAEFRNLLIPFQDPQKYGRSILENSSFIASSVLPDKALHGNGFVARLSGSTAEFLQIWLLMNAGKEPFFLDSQARLNLKFSPALIGWLFDKKGTYSFNFLSKIPVTYHNPKRKHTFGNGCVRIINIILRDANGKVTEIKSDIIPAPYALQIRSCQIKAIDIYLS